MSERINFFKIDAQTVDIDPATHQPIAKGMDGKSRYLCWGFVSESLYHTSVMIFENGLYGLGFSLDQIKRDFAKYCNKQLDGAILELGLAVMSAADPERGLIYIHNDLGIWEKIPDPKIIDLEKTRAERVFQRQH